MALNNLEDLFIDELKDTNDAERRLTKALPKMVKAAASEELSAAFEAHLAQTEEHIARLEQVFEIMGKAPSRKTCDAMVGLLEEAQGLMEEDAPESVMDAALIASAQKVEHYEMATYGCLRDWARLLGKNDAAKLLQKTLDEEGDADKKLTEIAQSLNVEALEAEEEEERETVSTGSRSAGNGRSKGKARTR